jgi:ABC-type glutathione transport system ATPase component
MATIQSLCERVVWLEQGELRKEGPTSKVTAADLEDALPVVRRWPRRIATANYGSLSPSIRTGPLSLTIIHPARL